ncbi:hypothetical protein DQQ10_21405 [Pseudochryseolinea flava]|uniref:Uncharacterized protein n=1 Tax=Pseudochryseolinea flava TaxID=2059302 RepID=A0A364XYI2_9BACT|nr:hypothetical protein DQQ10_21405 [Pseudochryseolinea flava]
MDINLVRVLKHNRIHMTLTFCSQTQPQKEMRMDMASLKKEYKKLEGKSFTDCYYLEEPLYPQT